MSNMSEITKESMSEDIEKFNNAMVQLKGAEEKFNKAIQNVWSVMIEMATKIDSDAHKVYVNEGSHD